MNTVKLKNLIKSNKVANCAAEILLDVIVVVRAKVTGSYTNQKEDFIAKKILTEKFHLSGKDIKYIDIGANNFRRGNNSYLFYRGGSRGILVEADPVLCRKLRAKRKGDRVINVAVSTESNDSIDFYVLSLPTRSTLDTGHVQGAIAAGLSVKEVIKIPCININDLLEQENFEPDFMSIDIEGVDYKVLGSLNFKKHPIKVIIAESSGEKNEHGETMDEFMKRIGYSVHGRYGSNVIYVWH